MPLMYKKLKATDSPVNLSSTNIDAINANQNSLVLDFDISGGSINVNLPSIQSLLFGINSGAGAMTFYIKGTIL